MKLFRTNNIDTVEICQSQFCFELPSSVIKKRANFSAKESERLSRRSEYLP